MPDVYISAVEEIRNGLLLLLLSVALMGPQEELLEATLPPEASRADASCDSPCPSPVEETSTAEEAP